MIVQFAKWGNSVALRIPVPALRDLGAGEGMSADLRVEDGKMIVTPIQDPAMLLENLIAQITDENIHDECFATPVGDEW